MDIKYLLENFRPVNSEDVARKASALEYAHKVSNTDKSYEEFLIGVSDATREFVFGGDADDYYYTSLISTIEQYDRNIDGFLCSILNKIVLQLEFQTRQFTTGMGPELFVCDGGAGEFYAAMSNVNAAAGLLLGEVDREILAGPWMGGLPHIDFNHDNLHTRKLEDLPSFLPALGRRIGALAVLLPAALDVIDFSTRFSPIEAYVDSFTSYVISGPRSVLEGVAELITEKNQSASVTKTSYVRRNRGVEEENSVIVFDGISGLPDISFSTKKIVPCRFVVARGVSNEDFRNIDYAPTEYVTPKPPTAISSYAPVSEENSRKMSSTIEFFHNVVAIKNGSMLGLNTPVDSTYIHFAESGEIAMDAGNEWSRTMMTDVYKSGLNVDGVVTSHMKLDRVLRVSGSAMPLTFTPHVHQFFSHFILQCLPRLLILREIGMDDAKIIVPHNLRKKQLAMLRLAGVSDDRIVFMPEGAVVKADYLLVPRAMRLAMTPFTIRLYEEMLAKVVKAPTEPTRRLLMSREARRTWRNMVNYDAVRHLLTTKHGFQEVRPELLTIEEEIELFSQSRILVGAEGAGLYASCFSQSTSNVVSLCDEDYMMPILGTIAALRGFNLFHVFGESFRSERDVARRLPYGHCDFSINPLEVVKMIDLCG